MASLDDKLLGEKLHYYCSSSSEEEDEDPPAVSQRPRTDSACGEANTGPKGVISDWRRFKQLESEKREKDEVERLALAKRLALTCRSERDDREAAAREAAKLECQDDDGDDDDFFKMYVAKRMEEMLVHESNRRPQFGQVTEIVSGEAFLQVVESKENSEVPIVIAVYEAGYPGCEAAMGCLQILAAQYPRQQFCSVTCSAVGMSLDFQTDGVPAILAYRFGQLFTSCIRITDDLGWDFYASDLEKFLLNKGILQKDSFRAGRTLRDSAEHAGRQSDSD